MLNSNEIEQTIHHSKNNEILQWFFHNMATNSTTADDSLFIHPTTGEIIYDTDYEKIGHIKLFTAYTENRNMAITLGYALWLNFLSQRASRKIEENFKILADSHLVFD